MDAVEAKNLVEKLDSVWGHIGSSGREEFLSLVVDLVHAQDTAQGVVGVWVHRVTRDADLEGPYDMRPHVMKFMGDGRLDRLERDARAGYASPGQVLKLIAGIRRRRG